MERWGFFLLCLGQIGFLLALFGLRLVRMRHDDSQVAAAIAGCIALSVIGAMMVLNGRRRGAMSVLMRAGRVCPRCRYPLQANEDLGVCPECGDPFTHEDNLTAWRARYPWLRL